MHKRDHRYFHAQTVWIISVVCLGMMVIYMCMAQTAIFVGNQRDFSFSGYRSWTSPWSGQELHIAENSTLASNDVTRMHLSKIAKRENISLVDSSLEEECIDQRNLSKPFSSNRTEKYLNLLDYDPPKYLPNYRNPCWWECIDSNIEPYQSNFYYTHRDSFRLRKSDFDGYFGKAFKFYTHQTERDTRWQLRCLPYFYLIGFSKCGTTDLFYNLMRHPMIDTFLLPSHSYYWNWWKNLKSGPYVPIRDFADLFDLGASNIQNITSQNSDYHPAILGEGTPMTIWDMDRWSRLPENEKCPDGPCYWSAHYIHHVTPQARFIVMMRNPIDRLYSDYLYLRQIISSQPGSAEDFHQRVETGIKMLNECEHSMGMPACLYDDTLEPLMGNDGVRIIVSLYAIHMKQWLKVFPREQFHFVLYEDYVKDKLAVLDSIATFLGQDPTPSDIGKQIMKDNSAMNTNADKNHAGKILPKTRKLLASYFRPYNQMLADLLQDTRFLWKDNTNISK